MTKPKTTRGGKRPGAGVKPSTGRTATVVTCSLLPDKLEAVDSLRGEMTRGKFLVSLIPADVDVLARGESATPITPKTQ
jgi:hypothetical protein